MLRMFANDELRYFCPSISLENIDPFSFYGSSDKIPFSLHFVFVFFTNSSHLLNDAFSFLFLFFYFFRFRNFNSPIPGNIICHSPGAYHGEASRYAWKEIFWRAIWCKKRIIFEKLMWQ